MFQSECYRYLHLWILVDVDFSTVSRVAVVGKLGHSAILVCDSLNAKCYWSSWLSSAALVVIVPVQWDVTRNLALPVVWPSDPAIIHIEHHEQFTFMVIIQLSITDRCLQLFLFLLQKRVDKKPLDVDEAAAAAEVAHQRLDASKVPG